MPAGRGRGMPQPQPTAGPSSGNLSISYFSVKLNQYFNTGAREKTMPVGRGKPVQAQPAKGAAALPEIGKIQIAPVSTMKPPKRPGFGEIGRKIFLSANHFPVKISIGKLYHYDVEIKENVTAVLKR